LRVMIMGVGAFAHALMQTLQDAGAEVACYLDRDYGHFGPASVGRVWTRKEAPTPIPLLEDFRPDLIIPMAISWREQPWAKELIARGFPLLSPTGEALEIEASRDFAARLCRKYNVPVPRSYRLQNRLEAREWMKQHPGPYVIKNPICSPFSPIHTIVCETEEDTRSWLERIDYAEGVFLQEYLGDIEAGHFVAVSGGEIVSLVTNQEYKRAYTGNLGPVAGAPMAGIVEQDPEDRYGLAGQLIHPLRPWLEESGFHGILQVTAMQRGGVWQAIEYNVRLGVTTGALLMRMLKNPLEVLQAVVQHQVPRPRWRPERRIGCSLTLAGYGYPFVIPQAPKLPVNVQDHVEGDLWWNEVDVEHGRLYMVSHDNLAMGHRIADVNACAPELEEAVQQVYSDIRKIHCLGSHYRLDLGASLWPPGTGF
jgi:phosphoribosylamine-glycine ligase